MTPLQLLNAQDSTSRSLSGGGSADPRHGQDAPGRDLTWQRALEHAQQANFATWFMPLPPTGEAVALQPIHPTTALTTPTHAAIPSAPRISAPRLPSAAEHGSTSASQAPQAEARVTHPTPAAPASPSLPSASRGTEPLAQTTAPPELPKEFSPHSPGPIAVATALLPPMTTGPASLSPALAQLVANLCACPVALTPAADAAAASALHLLTQAAPPLPALPSVLAPPPMPSPLVATPNQPQLSAAPSPEPLPESGPEPAAHASRPAPESPAKPAMRLHAEWSDQGVRIWLGADATQTLPLEQLTLHLRQWLTAQGARLLTLVCNGKTLWGEPADRVMGPPEGELKTPPDPAFPYPVYQSSTSAHVTGRVHAY